MAKVSVYNWKKEPISDVELESQIFEIQPRTEILHEVVRWQLASRRSGTHMVKTRSLVSGGGKKPFKQKGTGNARQGSTRSPLMPGGAKVFGPVPRDYSYSLPKKVRNLGLRMALSHLHQSGRLFIVDEMKSEGKTKEIAQRLKAFGLDKTILVSAGANEKVSRATRNLRNCKHLSVIGLNVFDLLKYNAAVISQDSLNAISKRLQVEA